MICNCDGCTAMDMKCANMASAEAKFTISMKTSMRAVPQSIVLNGYKGKHTLGNEDMYLHFLNIVYRITKSVSMIKNIVIQVVIWVASFCFPSAPLSPQFCGRVGGWKFTLLGYTHLSLLSLKLSSL